MNHSCAANVVWSYKRDNPLTKEVRALTDIAPGEELCPNYIDSFDNTFSSSRDRKTLLLKRWKFECECRVCNLEELKQNEDDQRRLEIRSLHQSIPALMTEWRVAEALRAAEKKLSLMMKMQEEMRTIIPSAMLEVVEMSELSKMKKIKNLPDHSHYIKEAAVLSEQLGDSFVDVMNQKLVQIQQECQSLQ